MLLKGNSESSVVSALVFGSSRHCNVVLNLDHGISFFVFLLLYFLPSAKTALNSNGLNTRFNDVELLCIQRHVFVTWEPFNHSVKNIVHHKHMVQKSGVHFVWFHKSYLILFKIPIFWFWLFWCCLFDWCKTLLRRFKEFALCFLWSWWETIFQTEKWDKLSPWVVRKFSCISL